MTISSADDPVAGPFEGNDSQTAFPFSFKVFAKTDLLVVGSFSGVQSTLVLDSDYSVVLNVDQDNNPGGTITYPIVGDPLPTGDTLTATTDLDAVQTTDIQNMGGFYPQVVEDALDRCTMLIKQVYSELRRSIRFPLSDAGVNAELSSVANRASRLAGFGASGEVTTYPLGSGNSTSASDMAYISDATDAVGRTAQARLRERVSILDFAVDGTLGVGDSAADTAALLAAISYVNDNYSTSNYKHQIFLPAGNYLFERIELQSLRGLTFVGEGTMDATRRKTRWAYAGAGSEDAALVIRSCAYIKFVGILFDMNSAESMDHLVLFQANESTAVSPLNRFSNLWITFEDCAFYVQPAIVALPTSTIWAKSCGNVKFLRCNLYCGDTVALKLGADTDVDPDTGQPTFANGLCVVTTLEGCYLRGDIQQEKSYQLRVVDTNFGVRNDLGTAICRMTLDGAALTFNTVVENCVWDRTGVTSFTGTLIEGGTHANSSGLTVRGSQLDGRLTLVRVNRGDAIIEGNRPLAYSGSSPNRMVSVASTGGNVSVRDNNDQGYLSVNLSGASILATMLHDERTSKWGPVITAGELAAAVTLPAAGAYQSILSQSHKFGGGYVRISYSVCILHKEAATTRVYTTRVMLDGVLVDGTVRRATGTAAGGAVEDQVTIAMTHVVYIDATDEAVTIELEVAQASGAGPYGIVQGADTVARTTWAVELLTY